MSTSTWRREISSAMASDTWTERLFGGWMRRAERRAGGAASPCYLHCHVLTDGLDFNLDVLNQQVELVLDELQPVHLVLPVLQRRHSGSPRQQRLDTVTDLRYSQMTRGAAESYSLLSTVPSRRPPRAQKKGEHQPSSVSQREKIRVLTSSPPPRCEWRP